METVDTTARLQRLRKLMKEKSFDIYIVPSGDSHQSEYIAPCDARREFICGFSGSAGTAVVTLEKAALATDGRYFNQASKQLDSNWELLKQGLEDVPTWQEWTTDQSQGGKTVAVDASVITASDARKLAEKIKKKGGGELVGSTENLVDTVWGKDRPARPNEKVTIQELVFAGLDFEDKIANLRKELDRKRSAGMVISMLDEMAWLFNLRGNDIPYNPVFFSYAIVTPDTVIIYIDSTKLDADAEAHLTKRVRTSVQIKPYEAIMDDVKSQGESLAQATDLPDRKFSISTTASWALSLALGGESRADEIRSPVGDAKAVKNASELDGMRACHVRDGAALTEYFAWLERELTIKKSSLDEVDGADKLEAIRSAHYLFVGLSFDTISSTGPNAAVIHYKPERGSCATIDPKQIYLCDSGAQYRDGTTDTTRTLHFGEPTQTEREAYTLVLKGVIALEKAVFPKGTTGLALDSFARQFLWKNGLDYRHGTGHGVGSFLNVHEGPVGIGTRVQYTEVPLAAGNVLSDEPGYYEDGKFGIRIENIIFCVPAKPPNRFGDKPWLTFKHATLTPLCQRLIDTSLLSLDERQWIDSYHAEVLEKTKAFFERDPWEARREKAKGVAFLNGKRDDSDDDEEERKWAIEWLTRETKKLEDGK